MRIGDKFGHLIVCALKSAPPAKRRAECLCSCGAAVSIICSDLKRRRTACRSCTTKRAWTTVRRRERVEKRLCRIETNYRYSAAKRNLEWALSRKPAAPARRPPEQGIRLMKTGRSKQQIRNTLSDIEDTARAERKGHVVGSPHYNTLSLLANLAQLVREEIIQ